jgi:hypothetical protein
MIPGSIVSSNSNFRSSISFVFINIQLLRNLYSPGTYLAGKQEDTYEDKGVKERVSRLRRAAMKLGAALF